MLAFLLAVSFAVVAPGPEALPPITGMNYAIPTDAWFVALDGNDTHSGTIHAPLRTISAALRRAPNGTTLVIREGIYRESLGGLNKRLTLQPYPHEKVWIKGSVEVS